jgi:hypothetical protein
MYSWVRVKGEIAMRHSGGRWELSAKNETVIAFVEAREVLVTTAIALSTRAPSR